MCRKTRQLSKRSSPGDIFYVPGINREGEYGLVLARFIELIEPNTGYLIEVFSDFYTSPPLSIPSPSLEKRLFRPIMCSLRFAEIPKWRVLRSDAAYTKEQSDYANIAIAFWTKLWKGGISRSVKRDKLVGFEPSICWRMHHIIFRVNAHLAGVFGPQDCYEYDLLPENLRVDNPAAEAEVFKCALAVDTLFSCTKKSVTRS